MRTKRKKIYFSPMSYWILFVLLIIFFQDVILFPKIMKSIMTAIIFLDVLLVFGSYKTIKILNNITKSKIENSHEKFWDRKVAPKWYTFLLMIIAIKSLIITFLM
jgi:hypothetical protein